MRNAEREMKFRLFLPLWLKRGGNTICFFVLGFCEYNCGGAKLYLSA